MKDKLHWNSFSGRILFTVVMGIVCVSFAVSAIIIELSKDIFVDTYGKSQERVFLQIENDLNQYHENLMKIINAVDASWSFRLYLSDEIDMDTQLAFQTVYQIQSDLRQAMPSNLNDINVMILGVGGKSYLNRAETITTPVEEILSDEITRQALENPERIHYFYRKNGYTSIMKNDPVLVAVKALTFLESRKPYGFVYISMKESDVEKFYNFFVSDKADFYLVDYKNHVVSSNQKIQVGEEFNRGFMENAQSSDNIRSTFKQDKQLLTIMETELPYLDFSIYGVIDNDKALDNLYNIPKMVFICGVIGFIVLALTFLNVKQTIRPLAVMTKKMSRIRGGDFSQYMDVSGTYEVKELAGTYNYMLEDLKNYIDKLIEIQQEKRKSEIKALQMQINPHYIYNTLASIKWLIWQGDAEKSTKTIDAFIMLLRNTISNTDEFITISQEIENLENYILINNTRYGDKVRVEFYVVNGCEDYLLPKLVLQPFIENAFFHAFPSDRKGIIEVFVNRKDDLIKIEIADDGIGMKHERLQKIHDKERKGQHFSGIGIYNVDERLKLIYGMDYGVTIVSEENRGTTVTMTLPVKGKMG